MLCYGVDGQIAALALLTEPVCRFVIEAFRADQRGYLWQWSVSEGVASWLPGMAQAGATVDSEVAFIGVTTSQSIALGAMMLGAFIYVVRRGSEVVHVEAPDADEDLLDLFGEDEDAQRG